MKTLAVLFSAFLFVHLASAQQSQGVRVDVTIENVLQDGGTIVAALHTAETFMKQQAISTAQVEGKQGAVTFTFTNVVPGTYAVMAMHDLNDNKRMDFDSNGMPQESYGVSGNEMLMGPPTFEGAKFEVGDNDLSLHIRF